MRMQELTDAVWWAGLYEQFRKERGCRLSRRAFVAAIKRAREVMDNE